MSAFSQWLHRGKIAGLAILCFISLLFAFFASESPPSDSPNLSQLVALSIPPGVVGLLLLHQHIRKAVKRRSQTIREILAALQAVLTGGALVGLGFELEPIISGSATGVTPGPLFEIQTHPLNTLASIVLIGLTLGISISTLSLAYALRYRRRPHRLLAACLAVFLCLATVDSLILFSVYVLDPVRYRLAILSISSLAFSVVSDLVGGSVAGFIIYTVFTLALKILRSAKPKAAVPTVLRNTALGVF